MSAICSIKNIIISLVISVEAVVLLVGQLIRNMLRIGLFEEIGAFLFSSNEISTSITLVVPVALFGFAIGIQKELLKPKENNKAFYQSPKFVEFKQTTFIGVLYTAIPIVPSFIAIVRKNYYDINDLGYYYFLLLLVSLISITSMYFAKHRLNEILDVYMEND